MSRIPPHDLEMEEAALGSMLLSGEARALGLDMLAPDDFHKPTHGRMFAAFSSLAQAGSAVDARLVSSMSGVDHGEVAALIGCVPASMNAKHYIGKVAELGAYRRAIGLAGELAEAAYQCDGEAVDRMLADPMSYVMPNYEPISESIEASVLAEEDHAADFVVPRLIARQEVAFFVGEPGYGKSTLLRQSGVCMASGMHPFTRSPIKPVKVLLIDCQESRGQAGQALRPLLKIAGEQYRGKLWVEPRPQGIDLTTRRHQRWLDAKVAKVGADVVIAGPLYNMVRGSHDRSKHAEETAELAMNALTDLMVRRDCALLIEAHAPHGQEMRVRGSKLWEDFPDFGFGLIPDTTYQDGRAMDVVRFRGDRHSGRAWPGRFVQGHHWPWEAVA